GRGCQPDSKRAPGDYGGASTEHGGPCRVWCGPELLGLKRDTAGKCVLSGGGSHPGFDEQTVSVLAKRLNVAYRWFGVRRMRRWPPPRLVGRPDVGMGRGELGSEPALDDRLGDSGAAAGAHRRSAV